MKKFFLILTYVFLIQHLKAQVDSISEKEIEITSQFYSSYILELSNGNTVLLQMEPRIEGFLMKVYDDKHNERVNTKIKIDGLKDINFVYVFDFIEINKQPVLFYRGYIDDKANKNNDVNKVNLKLPLYKLEINQYTGEFKNELLFEKINNFKYGAGDFFFKYIETKTKYALVCGYSSENQDYELLVNTYKYNTQQVVSKFSKTLTDHFELELLDAVMDNNNVYLCLNRKYKPKESQTAGFFKVVETSYIPENKVSVEKISLINNSKEQINLNLDNFIYSTKAQFSLDEKSNQLNLLLSAINPADNYAKTPSTKNIFYNISKSNFHINSEKEITNQKAINKTNSLFLDGKFDKNTFVNFPQAIYTDSLGRNTFVFQTVLNEFGKPDGFCTFVKKEFALFSSNREGEIEGITFLPFKYTIIGCMNGNLENFSYECNRYNKARSPRFYLQDEDYYRFKTFEVNDKIIFIYNMHPKNIGKNINDKLKGNTISEKLTPMIAILNKNYNSSQKVFSDDDKYGKLMFNVNVSSYNKLTKTFVVLATEIKGKKERLVWIKFK